MGKYYPLIQGDHHPDFITLHRSRRRSPIKRSRVSVRRPKISASAHLLFRWLVLRTGGESQLLIGLFVRDLRN